MGHGDSKYGQDTSPGARAALAKALPVAVRGHLSPGSKGTVLDAINASATILELRRLWVVVWSLVDINVSADQLQGRGCGSNEVPMYGRVAHEPCLWRCHVHE